MSRLQDAYFVLRIDELNYAYGVLDGHGHDHGKVASHTAAKAIETHLREHFSRLRSEPQQVSDSRAHHSPSRLSMLAHHGSSRLQQVSDSRAHHSLSRLSMLAHHGSYSTDGEANCSK